MSRGCLPPPGAGSCPGSGPLTGPGVRVGLPKAPRRRPRPAPTLPSHRGRKAPPSRAREWRLSAARLRLPPRRPRRRIPRTSNREMESTSQSRVPAAPAAARLTTPTKDRHCGGGVGARSEGEAHRGRKTKWAPWCLRRRRYE